MLKNTITNQYNLKQKCNKLKSSLNALFIIKKNALPLSILAGALVCILRSLDFDKLKQACMRTARKINDKK